jgi:DNA-binding NtrC family response regulator
MNAALRGAEVLSNASSAAASGADAPASEGVIPLEEMEKRHIQRALEHHQWNRAKTAQALGITPKTLYLKIKKYGIRQTL